MEMILGIVGVLFTAYIILTLAYHAIIGLAITAVRLSEWRHDRRFRREMKKYRASKRARGFYE